MCLLPVFTIQMPRATAMISVGGWRRNIANSIIHVTLNSFLKFWWSSAGQLANVNHENIDQVLSRPLMENLCSYVYAVV